MSFMQDVSQQDDSVAVDSTSALDTTQTDVGSDPATGNGQDPVNTKPTMKMVEAERYNKLMAAHQKALSDQRSSQAERADLLARLERLENAGKQPEVKQQQQAPGEPDFEKMSQKEIIDYLTSSAEERAFKRLQAETQKQAEAQEQQRLEQKRQDEEKWFQSKWDKVLTEHPDADISAIEKFMSEEKIYNPEAAYNLLNKDTVTQKEVEKARQETVKKISSNNKSFTEGSGKQGMEAPSKPSMRTAKERKNFIGSRINELFEAGSTNY